jgi:hypothetical protein
MRIHGAPLRALTGLLAVLVLAPATQANVALTPCKDVRYHGHLAGRIRQHGMGCDFAHGMVRHIIDHGGSRFHGYHCSASGAGSTSTWSCNATVGAGTERLTFALRITDAQIG